MEFKIGQKYKMRNGNRALCVYTELDDDYPNLMVNLKKKEEFTVTQNGKYSIGSDEDGYDIVGELNEIEVTVYAVVLKSGVTHARSQKQHAEYLHNTNPGSQLVEFTKTVEV